MRLSIGCASAIIILFFTAFGCKHHAQLSPVNTNGSNKYNRAARLLAGMDAESFPSITFYHSYCDSMNRGFNGIDSGRNSYIREWAKTELPRETKTIFYPFSGPDILNCIQFFPDADEYILMALERYGSLPVSETPDSLQLHCIYKSLSDLFGKGYFVTKSMVTDISNENNGVVPIACISLVRSGYLILDIKYKHLEEDGAFTEIPKDSLGTQVNDYVEIYFRKQGKEKIQKLIYFKTNLADDPYDAPDYFKLNAAYNPNKIPGLQTNKGMKSYLEHLPSCAAYIKSASYLMFQGHFTLIRQLCLDRCGFVLQDDTGIPFALYPKNKWKATFYGRYEKPISIFHDGYFQAELDSIYRADSARIKSLPFSLGYHYADSVQNLMTFEKK